MEKDPHQFSTDVGGTFTDVLAIDRVSVRSSRRSRSCPPPSDLSEGQSSASIAISSEPGIRLRLVFHGTTVGTNALITKNAAKNGFDHESGILGDVLALRRRPRRPRSYDLAPTISPALVPRERRIEADERMKPDGIAVVSRRMWKFPA